jgi:hypothetical protein
LYHRLLDVQDLPKHIDGPLEILPGVEHLPHQVLEVGRRAVSRPESARVLPPKLARVFEGGLGSADLHHRLQHDALRVGPGLERSRQRSDAILRVLAASEDRCVREKLEADRALHIVKWRVFGLACDSPQAGRARAHRRALASTLHQLHRALLLQTAEAVRGPARRHACVELGVELDVEARRSLVDCETQTGSQHAVSHCGRGALAERDHVQH